MFRRSAHASLRDRAAILRCRETTLKPIPHNCGLHRVVPQPKAQFLGGRKNNISICVPRRDQGGSVHEGYHHQESARETCLVSPISSRSDRHAHRAFMSRRCASPFTSPNARRVGCGNTRGSSPTHGQGADHKEDRETDSKGWEQVRIHRVTGAASNGVGQLGRMFKIEYDGRPGRFPTLRTPIHCLQCTSR